MTAVDSSHHSSPAGLPPCVCEAFVDGNQPAVTPCDWYSNQNRLVQRGFLLLNVWLAFHLFSIFIFPASIEPSSPLIQSCSDFVAPYLHFLFLDHGFDFFTPEPGASTLVDYSLELPDGSTQTGRFPTRSIFPRLFYHRYFMLSEFLGNGPVELQPLVERAFARNLCRETGATRATLTMVEHELASIEKIRAGLTLNDSSLFKKTPLGSYSVEELRLPYERKASESPSDSESPSRAEDEPKDTP